MRMYISICNDFQYFCEIHNRATHICFRYPCASWPYHDVIGMRDSKFCVCFYYFNKTLFTCADILPIRSKFDIHIMSFPKINCLGDFLVELWSKVLFLFGYTSHFLYGVHSTCFYLRSIVLVICFYEVNSFTFWIYFSFVVWWTWICLYQWLIVLETL